MTRPSPHTSQPEIITGALLYFMSAYRRSPCPFLAHCIEQHLACLAPHSRADRVVREIFDSVRQEWAAITRPPLAGAHASNAQHPVTLN
jgi:hypothetical protein